MRDTETPRASITDTHALPGVVEGLLAQRGSDCFAEALDHILRTFEGSVGTIHLLDAGSGMLKLSAQRGLPDVLRSRVEVIPIGKGMAGLAAERREPVQVCNLQTDTTGVAKPAAREARVEGSIAIPMLTADTLRGVLGVAKPGAYEFSAGEIALLQQVANLLGRACS